MRRLLAALVLAVTHVPAPGVRRSPASAAMNAAPAAGRTRGVPPFLAQRLLRALPILAVIIVIALPASQRGGQAAGPAAMSVSPAIGSTGVGGEITLDIDASNVSSPGLGGYVIVLTWDPSLLTLTSLTDSGWVTGGQVIVICTTATIDNIIGTAELDCTPVYAFGDGVTTTGPQALAQAVFQATVLGTTVIDITGSSLLDVNGDDLLPAPTLANGSAIVAPIALGGVAESPDLAALPTLEPSGARAHRVAYAGLAAGGGFLLAASMLAWAARRQR